MSIPKCPYCDSTARCEHLLLRADRTFLEAEDGALLDNFNERWSENYDPDTEDFDEIAVFQALLDHAGSLSETILHYTVEGPPGMSPACSVYYCSSMERIAIAIQRFSRMD